MSEPVNEYFDRPRLVPDGAMPPELTRVIELVLAGELTEEEVRRFANVPGERLMFEREKFHLMQWRYPVVQATSFFLPTVEWMDSLARLLRALEVDSVVEVAAGRGVLVAPMRRRGISWRATDIAPRGPLVEQGDALETARRAAAEGSALFCGWPPLNAPWDDDIATFGVPTILVAEWGGCSLNNDLAGRATLAGLEVVPHLEVAFKGFHDVPTWDGVHDQTILVADEERLRLAMSRWESLDWVTPIAWTPRPGARGRVRG